MTEFTKEYIRSVRMCSYLIEPPASEVIEHLCDEIERLQARVEELEAEIKESNDLLRSAFMIAKRDGKDTNWEAWHNQLSVALARQHAMMYKQQENEG